MMLPGKILVARLAVALAAFACIGAVAWVARGSASIPAGAPVRSAEDEAPPLPGGVSLRQEIVAWPDPPGDYGLFEGRDRAGPSERVGLAVEAEDDLGLRLVGVIGAGDSRVGVFVGESAGGTRLGGKGTRFADQGVEVVGWREAGEAATASAVAALLRRDRDRRVVALALEVREEPRP